MKKIFYILLSSLLMVSLSSCSSDENEPPKDKDTTTLTIQVLKASDAPDIGSIVYIFEGLAPAIGNKKYVGNGRFSSATGSWELDKKGVVAENEFTTIKDINPPTDRKYYTVVIESASDIGAEKRFFAQKDFTLRGVDINCIYVYKGAIVEK